MMTVERIYKGKKTLGYQITEFFNKEPNVVATVDTLEKAGCILRFLKGANVQMKEYALAVKTLREIDKENKTEEADDEAEGISGETDIGVSN